MSNCKALVSVIVPVYNASSFLKRCTDSILSQTYDLIELILVDDGSTDESSSICDAIAKSDTRVRAFHQMNNGPAAARNLGLENATGEYILFSDADDFLEKDACALAVEMAESESADCVIFGVCRHDTLPEKNLFEKETVQRLILAGDTASFTRSGYFVDAPWGKLYKASVIRNNDIVFPLQLRRSEDAVFSLVFYEYAKKVVFLDKILYHYEDVADSIVNRPSDTNVKMLPLVLQENDAFIAKYHPEDRGYAAANNLRVFTGMSEAESRWFFHPNNRAGLYARYRQFRTLLMEKTVRAHILDMRLTEIASKMRKVKYYLYKYPNFITFFIYEKYSRYRCKQLYR